MMGNVSNATLSEASRLQLLTFINPSLDPLEVGLTRYFDSSESPLLRSFEDLLNPYQVGLPSVEYFKQKIYAGRVQTVPAVIVPQQQLVSLNVASVSIDIINIKTVPHMQQQQHSMLPPLPLIQSQQSHTIQIASVGVTSVNIDITDAATIPQIKQQQHSVLDPLQFKQLEAHTSRAISQCNSKAHKNVIKLQPQPSFIPPNVEHIAEERGGPLLQPQPSFTSQSVAHIDKERGGPLLEPQLSFQSVANIEKERDGPFSCEVVPVGVPHTNGIEFLVAGAVT